jgi:hypothetical protein
MATYFFIMGFLVLFMVVLASGVAVLAGPWTGLGSGVLMTMTAGLYFLSQGLFPWQETTAKSYEVIARIDAGPSIAREIAMAKKDGKITNWEAVSIREAVVEQIRAQARNTAIGTPAATSSDTRNKIAPS